MQRKAIYQKEWLKLKWFLPALSVAAIAAATYFWFHLASTYAEIEPESMMWYRFAQLEDKPYSYLAPFFLFSAAVIAFAQFLPEAIQNRVRILTHLPVPLKTLVRHHLLAGGLGLVAVNGLLTLLLALIMAKYYPSDIVRITMRDCLFWLLPAITLYLGLSSAIIERSLWRKWSKLIPAILISLLFFKQRYANSDLIILAVGLWQLLAVYDSFLSVKTLRLKSLCYRGGTVALCGLILISGSLRYNQEFAKDFQKFYIFYSPILNDFIYQKNSKGHHFEYGTAEQTFDRQVYEDSLPFVYWKNRDIQGRLPIFIGAESFDKQRIKSARLSLQYQPEQLHNKEARLYPFFNPHSNKGVIPFPEEVLALKQDRLVIYDCETVTINRRLSAKLNQQLLQAGVSFPVHNIWGKTTNMKPFDWGYFVKDNQNQIFNLRRADDKIQVKLIDPGLNTADIIYMQMSENRQKNFYGYAVDAASHIYLVTYPDYHFIQLQLDHFDHRKMSFHLLSDPLHYVVRYDDSSNYRAALFDKQYNLLRTTEFL